MIENITSISVEKHFVTQSAPDIDALLSPLKAYGIIHLTVGILRNNLIHQNSSVKG